MGSTRGDFGKSPNHQQCTATSKRSGLRCKGTAVVGSRTQKCRMHGGLNYIKAGGTRNPNFRTGRHSRYLPTHLTELYEDALSNPDLLEMADNIALLESRINLILTELAAGEPMPRWSQLREFFEKAETAALGGKMEDMAAAFELVHKLLDNGAKWDTAWMQIQETMDNLRKVADTEIKRKKELNQMVPIERVIVLMAAVATAVKRNVKDPEQVRGVMKELALIHGSTRTIGHGDRERFPETLDVSTRGEIEA